MAYRSLPGFTGDRRAQGRSQAWVDLSLNQIEVQFVIIQGLTAPSGCCKWIFWWCGLQHFSHICGWSVTCVKHITVSPGCHQTLSQAGTPLPQPGSPLKQTRFALPCSVAMSPSPRASHGSKKWPSQVTCVSPACSGKVPHLHWTAEHPHRKSMKTKSISALHSLCISFSFSFSMGSSDPSCTLHKGSFGCWYKVSSKCWSKGSKMTQLQGVTPPVWVNQWGPGGKWRGNASLLTQILGWSIMQKAWVLDPRVWWHGNSMCVCVGWQKGKQICSTLLLKQTKLWEPDLENPMESGGGSLVREEKKAVEKPPWCTASPRCCKSRRISSERNKLSRKPGPCSKMGESDPEKFLLSRMRGKGDIRVTHHEKLSIFPNRYRTMQSMRSSTTHLGRHLGMLSSGCTPRALTDQPLLIPLERDHRLLHILEEKKWVLQEEYWDLFFQKDNTSVEMASRWAGAPIYAQRKQKELDKIHSWRCSVHQSVLGKSPVMA